MSRNIIAEFKEFAVRGNVVDMAVGIIIGAAFGKIVSSVVADIVMPPIGIILGGVDFSDLAIVLKSAQENAPAVTLNYGKFLQTVVDFTIVAFAVFMLVKGINILRRKQAVVDAAPSAPPPQEILLTEIRDLLKNSREIK